LEIKPSSPLWLGLSANKFAGFRPKLDRGNSKSLINQAANATCVANRFPRDRCLATRMDPARTNSDGSDQLPQQPNGDVRSLQDGRFINSLTAYASPPPVKDQPECAPRQDILPRQPISDYGYALRG
jgi:hypothetical protein